MSKSYDYIWVTVDQLTKFMHFLPLRISYPLDRLAKLYVDKIVRWHRIPVGISNRDPRFTSYFLDNVQKAIGTELNISMAFHP